MFQNGNLWPVSWQSAGFYHFCCMAGNEARCTLLENIVFLDIILVYAGLDFCTSFPWEYGTGECFGNIAANIYKSLLQNITCLLTGGPWRYCGCCGGGWAASSFAWAQPTWTSRAQLGYEKLDNHILYVVNLWSLSFKAWGRDDSVLFI